MWINAKSAEGVARRGPDSESAAPHINTAFPEHVCLLATALPNGYAQVSPRGSTMVYDDEHLALWERGRGSTTENLQAKPRRRSVPRYFFTVRGPNRAEDDRDGRNLPDTATALSNAETAVNIRQSRLVASAALIQALGGGWDVSQLPSREQIEENAPLNFSPFPPPEQVRSR